MFDLKKIFYKKSQNISQSNKMFEDNEIYMDNKRSFSTQDCPNYELNITGKGNKVYLHPFKGGGVVRLNIPTMHNEFIFGKENLVVHNLNIIMTNAHGCKAENIYVRIGDHNRFQGNVTILSSLPEGGKRRGITIGNYCLFAEGVFIHGRQDHLIYDIISKERINHEKDIVLNDNIWVGSCVHFLPGAEVAKDTIIGMNSIINKKYSQENVLLAGIPARIKKENVAWNIYLDESFLKMNNPL